MIRKRAISLFFLFVSIIMLTMLVMPHHHHTPKEICIKSDLPLESACAEHHTTDESDACGTHGNAPCDIQCMAHFDSSTPTVQKINLQAEFVFIATFIYAYRLFETDDDCTDYPAVYLERKHGTNSIRACGLRAPPARVA